MSSSRAFGALEGFTKIDFGAPRMVDGATRRTAALWRWAPLGVFAVALLVYLATRAPGLAYTDAGELAAAAWSLGVAHPTGYPLFVALAWPWSHLPWNSVIGGLNVLMAVWTAAAVAVTALVARQLLEGLPAGGKSAASWRVSWPPVVGALLLAFAPVVWSQATSVEVYALHLLLLCLTALACHRGWAWVGLGVGLLLSNHASSVFLLPGVVAWAWRLHGRPSRRLALGAAGLALGVPAALYGALVLRAAQLPTLNWGWIHRGWAAFWYHVSGAQFRVWLTWDAKTLSANGAVLLELLGGLTLGLGGLIALVGAYTLRRSMLLPLALLVVGNLAGTLGYGIPDLAPYFLPTLFVVALCLTVGLATLVQRAPSWLVAATLLLPLGSAGLHWRSQDRREARAVEHYARWVLANLAPNAVLLTQEWDVLCGPLWYLQAVEGVRPDVLVVDKELLRRTWYVPHLKAGAGTALDGLEPELDRYLRLLAQFEAEGPSFTNDAARVQAIQAAFEAVLRGLVTKVGGRPVYASTDVLAAEPSLTRGFQLVISGPVVRVSEAPVAPTRPNLEALPELLRALDGREDRLDRQLARTAARGVAASAAQALEVWRDEVSFRQLRHWARQLDPRGPFLPQLDRALP